MNNKKYCKEKSYKNFNKNNYKDNNNRIKK